MESASSTKAEGLAYSANREAEKRKKLSWRQTHRGKKKLARSMEHHAAQAALGYVNIGQNSMVMPNLVATSSTCPSLWYSRSKQKFFAVLSFLLQGLLAICRSFTPSRRVTHLYGLGQSTTPRLALLMHHEEWLGPETFQRYDQVGRQLFGRALRDLEQSTSAAEVAGADVSLREAEAESACQEFVHLWCIPKFRKKEWSLPRPPQSEWENWEECKVLAREKIWAHGYTQKKLVAIIWEKILQLPPIVPMRGSVCLEQSTPGGSSSSRDVPTLPATESADRLSASTVKDPEESAIARISEEAHCREILDRLEWLTYIPDTAEHLESLRQLSELAAEYVETLSNSIVHSIGRERALPSSMRVWIAETRRCLEQMCRLGWAPAFLLHAHDRFIRQDANQAPELYQDPGNVVLDLCVNCLALWRFVNVLPAERVMQVSQGEYGSRSNRSAKGPLNLRGNIIEALLGHCQRQASD